MTTIAWDGRSLAADSKMAGAYVMRATKAWRLPDGSLFGGSGIFEQVLQAKDWLEAGRPTEGKPTLDEMQAILIKPCGTAVFLDERLREIPISEPWAAVGSGAQFAAAALALGHTALEACQVAAQLDVGSAAPFTELTQPAHKKRMKRSGTQ